MEESKNQQFIDGLLAGEEPVFKEVFDTYYRSLVISAYQILKDEQISKDAAQEVFLELWKNRAKLHHKVYLGPYLKRSAINRALNILKSRKHHMSSGEEPLSYVKDRSRQPDEIYQDKELRSVVMQAIDQMPERCRAVYMLSRTEGLSHKEISEQLEISTKTIENQMTKALKIIRTVLAHYHGQAISIVIYFAMTWGMDAFQLFNEYHFKT